MIFQVRDGSFSYGSRRILDSISFSLEPGQVMSVLGSNGVGKTTLLKCMMGILKWEKGTTLLDEVPISRLSQKDLWKKIAYVPQAKGMAYGYSALDMVVLGRSAHIGTFAQPGKEDMAMAEKAMEDVGIPHLKNKACTQMSGGELQMVLIARALTGAPMMLVLDEPESNLDFKNQLIILNTIKRLSEEKHISAIVNTHYPAHAMQISDKALMLNRDGTNFYGPSEQVINEENMRKSFGVNVCINELEVENNRYRSVIPLSLA
ncbi:ABC transporter ATP-binding protein [Lachnospiraceae bacterium 54-53]